MTAAAARRSVVPLLFAAASVVSCRAADPPRPCPARFVEDPARAAELVAALRSAPEGATLLDRLPAAPGAPICFGPAAVSSITTDGRVLLDRDLAAPEAAARLGHLLDHVAEGLPMAHPHAGGCDAQVDAALAQEARALALELRLRRALGVVAPRIPYAFEEAFWRAPAGSREPLVLDYLRAHPDGAPGLDALGAGYARRCREAR